MNKHSLKLYYIAIIPIFICAVLFLFGSVQLDSWFNDFINDSQSFRALHSSGQIDFDSPAGDLPSCKGKIVSNSTTIPTPISEVDFPAITNHAAPTKLATKEINIRNKAGNYAGNVASYSYNQTQQKDIYYSVNQSISVQNASFQDSKVANQTNNGNQLANLFGATSLSTSNPNSNSFLANNTLTITTDLSDNNSPMMVGGDSNPGDPGIPVGDGTWMLLGLLVGYGVVVIGRLRTNICKHERHIHE